MTARRDFLKGAAAALAAPSSAGARRAPAANSETILVAGAGLAGLVAAYRLRESGRHVILIEARDAPGGRVRTVRGLFDDGLYGELGAARVAETHEYVLHWVNDLRLNRCLLRRHPAQPCLPSGQSAPTAMMRRRAKSLRPA